MNLSFHLNEFMNLGFFEGFYHIAVFAAISARKFAIGLEIHMNMKLFSIIF